MSPTEGLEVQDRLCVLRPRGRHSLVQAVDLVSEAIAYCRNRGVPRLLVDGTGLEGLPIPTLVDRFLMVEEWAQESDGLVVVAMVVPPEYIHPRKFGVKVAASFGLMCDVHTNEADALAWLSATGGDGAQAGR